MLDLEGTTLDARELGNVLASVAEMRTEVRPYALTIRIRNIGATAPAVEHRDPGRARPQIRRPNLAIRAHLVMDKLVRALFGWIAIRVLPGEGRAVIGLGPIVFEI